MILSEQMEKYGLKIPCEYFDENSFETFGLIESTTSISMCTFLDSCKYIDKIPHNTTMIITDKETGEELRKHNIYLKKRMGIAVTAQPKIMFFKLHNTLEYDEGYVRRKSKTQISSTAQISPLAYIADTNVVIGDNTVIEPFATIYENTVIGDGTVIRSGAVIGGYGFEFKRENYQVLSIKHFGGVYIGNDVEIQNNSCVDKAVYPWDDTIIGAYSKLDNLVHIGHAAKIGQRVFFAASATLSGRVVIGDDTWIGVGTTISNGIQIGKNARVNIGAVVTKNISDEGSVTGNFAIPHNQFMENLKRSLK